MIIGDDIGRNSHLRVCNQSRDPWKLVLRAEFDSSRQRIGLFAFVHLQSSSDVAHRGADSEWRFSRRVILKSKIDCARACGERRHVGALARAVNSILKSLVCEAGVESLSNSSAVCAGEQNVARQ